MNRPETILSEEPIGPNDRVTSLDEEAQRLVLADFSMQEACRYSLSWNRETPSFVADALHGLAAFSAALGLPRYLVAGWKYEASGSLRIRHLHVQRRFQNSGWLVHCEEGIGVAVLEVAEGELTDAHAFASSQPVGCFIALGAWVCASRLAKTPFRSTIEFFCWTHRVTPSAQFIEGLALRGGAIAYWVESDDRKPTLHIVASRPVMTLVSDSFGSASSCLE